MAADNNSDITDLQLLLDQSRAQQQGASTAARPLLSGEFSSSFSIPGGLSPQSGVRFMGGAGIPPPPPPPPPGGSPINAFATPLSSPATAQPSRVVGTPAQAFGEGIARLVKIVPGSGLCLGKVMGVGGVRVCAFLTGRCGCAHRNKLVLKEGYYVMHGHHENNLVPAPFISLEDATDYPEEFQTLMNAVLTTEKLIFLVENFKRQEKDGEVGAAQGVADVNGMDQIIGGSPLKRARLNSEDDEVQVRVREVLNSQDARLLRLEVNTGAKTPGMESVNIWNELEGVTAGLECANKEVKDIKVELTKVAGTTASAAAAANHANRSLAHLQTLSQPNTEMMNMLRDLAKKVEQLEKDKVLLSEVAREALTVAMMGRQTSPQGMSGVGVGAEGGINATTFAAYKAEVEDKLRDLRQQVDNVEVVIGGITFTDLEFCIQYAIDYFPERAYECIIGFGTFLQHATNDVETQGQVEASEIHAHKLQRNPYQSSHVASFKIPLPILFQIRKDASRSFARIASFEVWSQPGGVRFDLEKRMRTHLKSLSQHIDTMMSQPQHLVAKVLCKNILQQVHTWWTWFSSTVTDFYNKLVTNAAPGANPTKEVKASAWAVTTSAIVTMFEELRKARQTGLSAELAIGPGQTVGRFLYATLQELRVMNEFQEKSFDEHASIQLLKMTHVFENYLPRGEGDVGKLASNLKSCQKTVDRLVTKTGLRTE